MISEETYHQPQLENNDRDFDSPGVKLSCLGGFVALTKYKGQFYKYKVHVIETANGSNLLGRNVAVAMGLVQRVEEVQKCQSTFGKDLGLLNIKPVRICLREDAEPYAVNTARRVSGPLLPKVKAELERMGRH